MKKRFFIILIAINFFTAAQAANLDDVVDAIDRINTYMQAAVSATVDTVKNLLWEANPNLVATVVGNKDQATANQKTIAQANDKSLARTKVALKTVLTRDTETFRLSSGLNASDTFGYVTPGSQQGRVQNPFTGAITRTQAPTDNDTTFNLDTLLGPVTYPNFVTQNLNQNPPYNFILLAGNAYQPASTLSLKERRGGRPLTDTEIRDLQSSPQYEAYQAALRAYIAAQSVGLSNLYQMLQKRIPQPNIGTELGFTAPISQLELEQYLATRRSQQEQWYAQMQAASPATVARETLFVLAEIREQLFQMQQQNERLLATVSVMQLQTNQANRAELLKLEKDISDKLPK